MEKKNCNDSTVKDKIDSLNHFDNLHKMRQRNTTTQLKISQPLITL